MPNLLDLILDNTARQRYALVKLFMDHPSRVFSRNEVLKLMGKDPYDYILTYGHQEEKLNPFCLFENQKKVPTILRDRLRELVEMGIVEIVGSRDFEKKYRFCAGRVDGVLDELVVKNRNDVSILSQIHASLAKYEELPIADLFDSIVKKSYLVNESDEIEPSFTIVDFETPVRNKNIIRHMLNFFTAICDRQFISKISYEGHFNVNGVAEIKELTDFMPYVLKESRGQWYLAGKCPGDIDFRTIPVNRIIGDPEFDMEREFEREPFNPEEYWDGCLGITRYGSPISVTFNVKNGSLYNNIDYIRTVPIVKEHQQVSMNGEWMKVVLDKIYIGPELIRVIRSFGKENIRNVSPSWLEEDLWESGYRNSISFSISFYSESELVRWKQDAEKQLRIGKKQENDGASVSIAKSLNKKSWYKITVKNVLINSTLYFFFDELSRNFGNTRLLIRNRHFLD